MGKKVSAAKHIGQLDELMGIVLGELADYPLSHESPRR